MSKFASFNDKYSEVKGSFNKISTILWDQFLTQQTAQKIKGNFLEIGVQHGRSAFMILEHASTEEEVYLCDRYFRPETKQAIAEVRTTGVHILDKSSVTISVSADLDNGKGAFRWVHIDGHHSASVFARDLKVCADLLCDEGMMVIDDFMSNQYPQITGEVFRYLHAHPAEITLILCGYNKGYLCRPLAAKKYLRFIRDELYNNINDLGVENIVIHKSTDPNDFNCFGICPSNNGRNGYQGPDWNHSAIDI